MTDAHPLLVIVGATASGKSALAMEVARQVGGKILSADSMQVYRGMDIGTAKPTSADRKVVPHFLLDVADPTHCFAVSQFLELAEPIVKQSLSDGVPLIVTGGTPLYYKALFQGLFEGPSSDMAMRKELAELSNDLLHAELSRVDPAAASRIHLNDTKRLVRAIEVHRLTGQTISSLQTQWSHSTQRFPAVWVGVGWERSALSHRINQRARQMLEAGWLDEVKFLLDRFGALSKTAAEATGYAELMQHLQGRLSFDDAREQIKIATRQLARRQLKWFRRFQNIHWLDGSADLRANAAKVVALWNS